MKINNCYIQFTFNKKDYRVEIYYLDGDNYSIRLFDNKNMELFSTWIDSNGGEVSGNAEVYTSDNIDNVIEKVYDVYNFFSKSNLLINGDE